MKQFRGFTKTGKWVYGNHYGTGRESLELFWMDVADGLIDPETIGQSTGLKDKNGKDLDWWEGDLFRDSAGLKVIIKDQGCFWFESILTKNKMPCFAAISSPMLKVGNATENPELLKEKK